MGPYFIGGDRDDVAPPGNQAETENTNIDLQRWEKLIYSTFLIDFRRGMDTLFTSRYDNRILFIHLSPRETYPDLS